MENHPDKKVPTQTVPYWSSTTFGWVTAAFITLVIGFLYGYVIKERESHIVNGEALVLAGKACLILALLFGIVCACLVTVFRGIGTRLLQKIVNRVWDATAAYRTGGAECPQVDEVGQLVGWWVTWNSFRRWVIRAYFAALTLFAAILGASVIQNQNSLIEDQNNLISKQNALIDRQERDARSDLQATTFLRLRTQYKTIAETLPGRALRMQTWRDLEESLVNLEDAQRQAMIQHYRRVVQSYWNNAFEEWYVTTQLVSIEHGEREVKLWNDFYVHAIGESLKQPLLREELNAMLGSPEVTFAGKKDAFRKALFPP